MKEFKIDVNRIRPVSNRDRFWIANGYIYMVFLLFLGLMVFSRDFSLLNFRILFFVCIGMLAIVLIASALIKPRNYFENLTVKLDLDKGLIIIKGKNIKNVNIRFDEIGRVLLSGKGLLIYKKGLSTFAGYFARYTNIYDRKNRCVLPFELENFNKIVEIFKAKGLLK